MGDRQTPEERVPAEGLDRDLEVAVGHYQAGRRPRAEAICRRVLKTQPDHPDALNLLGVVLMDQGKLEEAVATYRRLVAVEPDNARVLYNAGLALKRFGRFEEAIATYRRALAIEPDLAEAHNSLGAALAEQDEVEDAIGHYRRALALKPDHVRAHNNLGNALQRQGRLDEAVAAHRQALALEPDWAEGQTSLGNALRKQGKRDEAIACYENALTLKPDYAKAYYQLAKVNNFEPGDPQIASMERSLENPENSVEDRATLSFALGAAYDRIGDYDGAFQYFSLANEMIRQKITYDATPLQQLIDRIIRSFDESIFAEEGGFGCDSDVPIFVVGMPRSGKTLVEQILSQHPLVHGAGETRDLARIVSHLPQSLGVTLAFPESVRALTPGQARELGEKYVAASRRHAPDTPRITETVPANYLYIGLIRLILPRARIVHCTRDPLDNCLFCYFKYFKHMRYSFDLTELGEFYLQYRRLMEHWRAVLPEPVFEVRYEDLVSDPVRTSRDLFSFCGLDPDVAYRDDLENDRARQDANPFPIPLHTEEVGRWRRYERHLEPVKRMLGERCVEPTG